MSVSTITAYDPAGLEFRRWLRSSGFREPRGTMLHHCWSPDSGDYSGRSTILGVRRTHMRSNHWSDIGANAYACPDGVVYSGRPLDEWNWCHGYIHRGQPEAELWSLAEHDRMFPNRFLFGLETVANFDWERPYGDGRAAHSFECAMRVLVAVHTVFKLPADHLFFHRDAENKTCPGNLLDRREVRQELARRLTIGDASAQPKRALVVLDGLGLEDCKAQIETNGSMTVAAVPLLSAIGLASLVTQLTESNVIHGSGRAFVSELRAPCEAAGWELAYVAQPQGPRLYPKRLVPPIDN